MLFVVLVWKAKRFVIVALVKSARKREPVPVFVVLPLLLMLPVVNAVTVGEADQAGATPTPPDTNTEPVATSANLDSVVEAEA